MSVKNYLTNEKVTNRFENPFTLVNYAIEFARKRIGLGDIGEENLSSEILESIADGSDKSEMEDLTREEQERELELEQQRQEERKPQRTSYERREELVIK